MGVRLVANKNWDWGEGVCNKCGEKIEKEWVKSVAGKERLVYSCGCEEEPQRWRKIIKHYPDVVALGHDKKTGRPIAIKKDGKKIDVSDTRYDTERDPHGWKATGKNPREKDKFGRPIYHR